jgi:hypothetical protein
MPLLSNSATNCSISARVRRRGASTRCSAFMPPLQHGPPPLEQVCCSNAYGGTPAVSFMCCSKRSTASRIPRVMQSGQISTVLPFGWSCHQVSRETGGDCTAHSGIATLQPSASALARTSDFLVATPPTHLPHLQHLITYKSLRLVISVVDVAFDMVLVWMGRRRRGFLAFSRGTRAPRCLRLLAA